MELFERHEASNQSVLVHSHIHQMEDIDADEFYELALAAGAEIQGQFSASRSKPDPKTFIGSGKAEEIAEFVKEHETGLVIFDHRLSPAQERNLEKILQCRVMDRTGLILDIFARRARTYEGKLQVELAQLNHLATRLVRGWSHLERQKGGIGLRGPGETQLETDRRLLGVRVRQLNQRLAKVRQTRQQGRAARKKASLPTISLVGYTNAGKSSLFNRLAASDVLAADQLFATLDPTLRRVNWPGLGEVILIDTVGFVKQLPHTLVDSFKSTLEETLEADLLLHVIDSANPQADTQIQAVEKVLEEIGANVPILKVNNKIDLSGLPARIHFSDQNHPSQVNLSTLDGTGINLLHDAVRQLLDDPAHPFHLTIPPRLAQLRHSLFSLNLPLEESVDEAGNSLIRLEIPCQKLRDILGRHHVPLHQVLPAAEIAFMDNQLNHEDVPATVRYPVLP